MSSIDCDNLRKIASECKGFLRDDIVQALEAGADEITRLQEVVRRCHVEIRQLKAQR